MYAVRTDSRLLVQDTLTHFLLVTPFTHESHANYKKKLHFSLQLQYSDFMFVWLTPQAQNKIAKHKDIGLYKVLCLYEWEALLVGFSSLSCTDTRSDQPRTAKNPVKITVQRT